jgi:hypothetical protein
MSELAGLGVQALALALAGCAIAAALGAILTRSLFAMCAYATAAGVLAAAVVLLLGASDGAFALALFAGAWAPILLLAGMLLSARSAKAPHRKLRWLSVLAAGAAAALMVWPLTDPAATASAQRDAESAFGLGFWIAPLIFAAAAACVGLLGYGERGALGGGRSA